MTWKEWKDNNYLTLETNVRYETIFVDRVLSRVYSISPEDVSYQYKFIDSNGKTRYIDFVIHISDNEMIPIELDGKGKFDTYDIFDDTLARQNDLLKKFKRLLRYSNKQMFDNPTKIVKEITSYVNELKLKNTTEKVINTIEKKLIGFKILHNPDIVNNTSVDEEEKELLVSKKVNENLKKTSLLDFLAISIIAICLSSIVIISIINNFSNTSTDVKPNHASQIQPGFIQSWQAISYIGKNTKVCGKAIEIKEIGKGLFINFDKKFPKTEFYAVIWKEDLQRIFKESRYTSMQSLIDLLQGYSICIEGNIEEYKGKARITIKYLSQIEK